LSNPFLDPETHERLVRDLMNARYAIAGAADKSDRISARLRADAAKRALGERGDVWWNDGAPDYNRKLAVQTPYAGK
jgi:CO/xanthine dehydrogenase Mo-binding subunit